MAEGSNRLSAYVAWVCARAKPILVVLTLLTLVFGAFAYSKFRINSDLHDLIDQTSDWRAHFDRFQEAFPDLVKTAVVVVSGTSLNDVERTTADVVNYLQSRDQLFTAVAAPGSEPFFRDHAFLYMDDAALEATVDKLALAQPLIATVHREPNIGSVLRLLQDGFDGQSPIGFDQVVTELSGSTQRLIAGQDSTVNWSDRLFPLTERRYQLIFLKPQSAFDQALPDAVVMASLREMLDEIKKPGDVRIELTGEIALQHEEIEAAVSGVSMAGWLAVILLLAVLVVGVRSGKIVAATFALLAMGVVWTGAFAMLTVGEFNTLSLVFIVMFFGLGVDFALHFSLRFQESVNRGGQDLIVALTDSTRSVGRAISLCTVTTAIGFLGFWPTAYQGLADLGVISAGGMAVAWFLTFTFLPAFFTAAGAPRAHQMDLPTSEKVVSGLLRHRGAVLTGVVMLAIVAGSVAWQARFDYSVLALKDPDSASMQALRELQREKLTTDYQLVMLRAEKPDAEALQALSTVESVLGLEDFIPGDQDDKLTVVEELSYQFWDVAEAQVEYVQLSADATRQAISMLLPAVREDGGYPVLESNLLELQELDDESLLKWQRGLMVPLLAEIGWLHRALNIGAIGESQLPASMTERMISDQGERLYRITPAQDIAPVAALSEFIEQVRGLHPDATGRPVIEWGVGQIVLSAFQQAMIFAILGIALILLVTLRRVSAMLLVMCPLILASTCTFAVGVMLDLSVNMASVLVLPLIFGLGVDNGIHVVDRYLHNSGMAAEQGVDNLMHSSTPRAVLLSTLTTIGAFSALSISGHAGTASIGLLLGVSVGFILLFTVFVLPVLLSFLTPRGS